LVLFDACDADIKVRQDSALSPIYSAFYIAPLFKLRAQALNLNTSIFSFVDNSLLIFQVKT